MKKNNRKVDVFVLFFLSFPSYFYLQETIFNLYITILLIFCIFFKKRFRQQVTSQKIIIVSSSPQVRYPDYYGIDMSRMNEFSAFRAAISLLKERGMHSVIDNVYQECKRQLTLPITEMKNAVKQIYEPFTDKEISDKMAVMLKPDETNAEIEIVYQSIDGLHKAITGCPGDWYFSGDYPTPGGNRLVNMAFINYYEGNTEKR